MSGDDYCCYCNAFGMRCIIQRPDPNCCTCRSWRGKAGTFPVPALTQVTVRRTGYALFCLGILTTLCLFAAMLVSQQQRYPGPSWCDAWETNCKYQTLESGGIGVMNSFDITYLVIMLGTLILNSLGLIGVGREKRSILRVVGVLLVLFFVAQVTLSSVHGEGVKYTRQNVRDYPHEVFHRGQVSMYESLKKIRPTRETWDDMQGSLRCCGVLSYKDWQEYHGFIPDSCDCERRYADYGASCAPRNLKGDVTKYLYRTGCLGKLLNDARWSYAHRQNMLWKAGLGLAFVQLFPTLFALVIGFRKESSEVAYKGVAPPAYAQSLGDCKTVVINEQPVVTEEGHV